MNKKYIIVKLFVILFVFINLLSMISCKGDVFADDKLYTAYTNPNPNGNLSSKKDLLSFRFDTIGVDCEIDGTTIYASILDGNTLFKPTFTTNGYQVRVDNILQISGESEHDFSQPVNYIVYAEDGTYKEYTISLNQITPFDKSLDNNPDEWFLFGENTVNDSLAFVNGIAIWQDSDSEHRTDFGANSYDLDEVRWGASITHLSILAKFNGEVVTYGDGVPALIVLINNTNDSGKGQNWVAGNSNTNITAMTEWNRQIITRFSFGSAMINSVQPFVFREDSINNSVDTIPNNPIQVNEARIYNYNSSGYIELRVSWTDLGIANLDFQNGDVEFIVCVGTQVAGSLDLWEIAAASDILDVAGSGDAWSELSDGSIDDASAVQKISFKQNSGYAQPIN